MKTAMSLLSFACFITRAFYCAPSMVSAFIARGGEAQDAVAPESHDIMWFEEASADDATAYLELSRPDKGDEFDRAAIAELRIIDASFMKYEFESQLRWSKRAGSFAHPKVGIAINRDQLRELCDRYDSDYSPLIHTFVLSHEKAHLIQFRELGKERRRMIPRRVLEAQADILAGAYIHTRPEYQTDEATECLLEVAADSGVPTADWVYHPTPGQRKSCVELGVYAQKVNIRVLSGDLSTDDFKRINGFRPGEDFFKWTLRRAFALTGIPEGAEDPLDVDRSLVIDDDALEVEEESIDWGDKESGDVTVVLNLSNNSDHKITSDVSVAVLAVSRDDHQLIRIVDASAQRVYLSAKESKSLRYKLRWATAVWRPDENAMPSISSPTDDDRHNIGVRRTWRTK